MRSLFVLEILQGLSTYVADHGNVSRLRDDGFHKAGVLGAEEGRDSFAHHVGDEPCRSDGFASRVVPAQQQLHVLQQGRVIVDLQKDSAADLWRNQGPLALYQAITGNVAKKVRHVWFLENFFR